MFSIQRHNTTAVVSHALGFIDLTISAELCSDCHFHFLPSVKQTQKNNNSMYLVTNLCSHKQLSSRNSGPHATHIRQI